MPSQAPPVTPAELAQFRLFADLAASDLAQIVRQVRTQTYDRGEVVIEHLSNGRDLFLLIDGQLLVNRYAASGLEVGYGRIRPFGYFGELAAFDEAPRSVNIVALTPARVGCISRSAVLTLLDDIPGFARTLIADMAGRIRNLSNRLFEATALSVPGRVENELVRMCVAAGIADDGGVLENMPTHAELAALIGGQRETVTRTLNRLVDLAIVAKQGRNLVIRDFEGLLERAEAAES